MLDFVVQVLSCEMNIPHFKGVLHPWTLFLKTLCIFSKKKKIKNKNKKIKQLPTKYQMDLNKIFQGALKSQFYFSRDHGFEVTVKTV